MAPKAAPIPTQSAAEAAFDEYLRLHQFTGWVREYPFAAPLRNWRFDFAWPKERFAVEIEGITPTVGRHQRVAGFVEDCIKYEEAMLLGWRVYRVPHPWVVKGERRIWRPRIAEVLEHFLGQKPRRLDSRRR